MKQTVRDLVTIKYGNSKQLTKKELLTWNANAHALPAQDKAMCLHQIIIIYFTTISHVCNTNAISKFHQVKISWTPSDHHNLLLRPALLWPSQLYLRLSDGLFRRFPTRIFYAFLQTSYIIRPITLLDLNSLPNLDEEYKFYIRRSKYSQCTK
jgi:hypothetical protein